MTDSGISFDEEPFLLEGGLANAEHYLDYARYAELHVDEEGDVAILNLRDMDLQIIDPPDE